MRSKNILPYLLLLPGTLLILCIDFLPGLYAIFLSLFDIKYFKRGDFVGFGNYIKFLNDKTGLDSLALTVRFALTLVIATFVIGLVFALIAKKMKKKGSILIGILLVPWVTSKIISSLLIKWLLIPFPGGILFTLFELFNLKVFNFLAFPDSAYLTLVIVEIWEHVGFAAITLYAGLAAIPEELEEASKIDGANYFQNLIHLIIPLLLPSILVVLSMLTLFFFNEVTTIIALTSGGPIGTTTTLSYYVLKKGFHEYQTSYGNTLSTILFSLTMALIFIQIKFVRRKEIDF